MTVAAVILAATTEGAVAETLGQPRVRRLADIAWSGGALPVVVVAADPEGAVRAALIGSEATLAAPAPIEAGPVGQIVRGAETAAAEVRETSAVLVWPARMTWVGPETVTSLIEAHGMAPDSILRPAWHGDPGWPVLVPVSALDALRAGAPSAMPPEIIESLAATIPTVSIELGDPGVVHDVETPREALPAYEGPPEPPAGHRHEWGEDVESEAGLTPPDETT